MRVKFGNATKDVSLLEVTKENYIVPRGEEDTYHCRIEQTQFNPRNGQRVSRPRIQKFNAKMYPSIARNLRQQGWDIEVLYDPTEFLKAQEEKQQQAMEQRMKDLSTRENRFECRSYVADRRLPAELLDLFDTSDFNEFVRKADTFMGVVQRAVGAAPLYTHEDPGDANATPAGFAVTKHTPRQYPPFRGC